MKGWGFLSYGQRSARAPLPVRPPMGRGTNLIKCPLWASGETAADVWSGHPTLNHMPALLANQALALAAWSLSILLPEVGMAAELSRCGLASSGGDIISIGADVHRMTDELKAIQNSQEAELSSYAPPR
jgi:hypothetical protein